MTSPKYSADKHTARYDLKRSFSRMIPPFIVSLLFCIVNFIAVPITTISSVQNGALGLGMVDKETVRKQLACVLVGNQTTSSFVLIGIFAVIIGVIFAFWAFLPIMRKSSVNFFFSGGLNRKTYFKNRVIASTVLMAVSAVVPIIVDIIININYLGHIDFIIHQGIFLFLEHFAYMVAGFSLMSISMMSCYTVTESLFFGAGIIWAPSILVLSLSNVFQNYLRGFTVWNDIFQRTSYAFSDTLIGKFSLINPLFFGKSIAGDEIKNNMYYSCFRSTKQANGVYTDYFIDNINVGFEKSGSEYILPIFVWLILSGLFIFAAKNILDKRKLEKTALHSSNMFVSVFVSIEISIYAATFVMPLLSDFEIVQSNFLNALFGVVVGIIVYLILLSISRRKVKHNFKLIAPVIASSVCLIVVIIVCIKGAFGYSTYVPKFKDIEYATINSEYIDASGVMSNNQFVNSTISGAGGENLYLGNANTTGTYIGKFNTKESIKKIENIQKNAYENRISKNDEPYVTVYVKYVLKNGKTVSRDFSYTKSDISLDILDLTQSEEYKKELEYIMSSKYANKNSSGKFTLDEDSYYFTNYANENNVKDALAKGEAYIVSNDAVTKTKIENTPALRDAILKDIETIGYKKLLTSGKSPLGAVNFKYDENVDGYYQYDYMSDATYYIWDDMVNTVNYIKSLNKFSAFDDYSNSGEISYLTVTPLKNKIAESETLTALSTFESSGADEKSYYEYQGSELDEKDILKTYSGKKYTNKSKTRDIFNASSIYSLCNEDDYVVLIKFENGTYLTKYLTKSNAQKVLR